MEDKAKAIQVWGASPAGTTFSDGAKPGTKDFFQNVLAKRAIYEFPWLYDLVDFASFRAKNILELGCGAGYDAFEICRHAGDYTGIDIAFQNADRTKKHLAFFGYFPKVAIGDVEVLPFGDEIFEIVFSNGVLHHTTNIETSFQEAFRVLRKGGEFWVIVYHKNSIFFWLTLFIFDHILSRGFLKRRFRDRLSMIEFTTSKQLPLVNVYSRRTLRNMLRRTGFQVDSVWVRKLVKEDLPAIPIIGRLWRYIPQSLLDLAGKAFGWYVITKARKV